MITSNLLRGEQVRLAAPTAADLPTITRWWADADFLRLYNTAPAAPRNEDQLSRRFDLSQTSNETFLFAIRPLDEDTLLGLLEFDGVDWSNRTTFVSIGIGEAKHRGRGYGADAMRVGLRFAFHELNLHRVCLTVFSYNAPAISLYGRLGFAREGVYREHIERDGRRYDMILYGLLRREWEEAQGSGGAGEIEMQPRSSSPCTPAPQQSKETSQQTEASMINLAVLLEDSAREAPASTAIIFNDMKLPYAAVNAAANQIANGLVGLGIKPGDKVALTCPNLPYFPLVYYGILKAGAVVVPLNVLLKGREIAYHLQDSDAKAYFCFQGTPDLPMGQFGYEGFQQIEGCEHFFMITADPAGPSPIEGTKTLGQLMYGKPPTFDTVATKSDDTAVILYTSGTTGSPKGAELSHSNMLLNARLSDTMYQRADNDVQLVTLPLFHSFGQTVQMNAGFYNRNALTLLPRFDPDAALSIMERDNVTIFAGVPTMYWAMLNHPNPQKFDLEKIARNLRLAVSGGSAMPVEVMRAFGEKFKVEILEGYGLSETSPIATFNRLDRPAKPGSVGLPVWGVAVRVVDLDDKDVPQGEMGEIVIKGHNIMKGYYKKPEATAEAMRNGWFHTGDIGKFDEDGFLTITDRVKDMIIRGGFNVYPREIEEVMMTHPAVSLAAVLGVPDERHGEEVKAYVILKPGQQVSEDEMIDWCRECMAGYKYPRLIEFREALPMTATGKILKRELR